MKADLLDSQKDMSDIREYLDEELFEASISSETEKEFKEKAKHIINGYKWQLKTNLTDLPVNSDIAKYTLNKILGEIESGTSEYWH